MRYIHLLHKYDWRHAIDTIIQIHNSVTLNVTTHWVLFFAETFWSFIP